MEQGKRKEHPSRKRLEIKRVSKDIQRQNDEGQVGGTSKQKTVRNHKGEQRHSKANMTEGKREEHLSRNTVRNHEGEQGHQKTK